MHVRRYKGTTFGDGGRGDFGGVEARRCRNGAMSSTSWWPWYFCTFLRFMMLMAESFLLAYSFFFSSFAMTLYACCFFDTHFCRLWVWCAWNVIVASVSCLGCLILLAYVACVDYVDYVDCPMMFAYWGLEGFDLEYFFLLLLQLPRTFVCLPWMICLWIVELAQWCILDRKSVV